MSAERYGAYSVLMSVYSKENPAWLKLAIESIQDQTLPTSDFVLVCDGPLTPELDGVIAEKHCQMGEILMVVRLEKNVGLGNALNEGIKHCRNELVARMDSRVWIVMILHIQTDARSRSQSSISIRL